MTTTYNLSGDVDAVRAVTTIIRSAGDLAEAVHHFTTECGGINLTPAQERRYRAMLLAVDTLKAALDQAAGE